MLAFIRKSTKMVNNMKNSLIFHTKWLKTHKITHSNVKMNIMNDFNILDESVFVSTLDICLLLI